MLKITYNEKRDFLKLFNQGGYVLDFSTADFNDFTKNSIGIAICEHYGKSKGGSLADYINEASEDNVIRLLNDLLDYYEKHYDKNEKEDKLIYGRCRSVMDRVKLNSPPFLSTAENLKEKFSSDYVSRQMDIMFKMQNENPTEAIGKAKEFIETCCKTILENSGKTFEQSCSVNQLVKETMVSLKIASDNIGDGVAEGKTIKAILGSLQGIATHIAELRNSYGSGHGKSAKYRGLTPRHAKLAVESSLALVNYLWSTYEWRKENERV